VNDLLILLGKRVHDLRAAKEWSQEEFAHVSGLHRTYIGQIERGEKNISFENLSKISIVLGISLSELLEGLEGGNASARKQATVELRGRRIKNEARQALEHRRLLKRLMLQHREMGRTIVDMESVRANGGPKANRTGQPRSLGRSRGPQK
jgi:transcriptional regulator with XRE-family HTH domain